MASFRPDSTWTQPPPAPPARRGRRAFTLVEMLVVVVILAVVAGLIALNQDRLVDQSDDTVARALLRRAQEATLGTEGHPGYLDDLRYVPGFKPENFRLHDLFSPSSYPDSARHDPIARRGWRGPYLGNPARVRNLNPERQGLFPSASERRSENDPTFLERGFFTDSITSPYGLTGDLVAADPWGNPVVVQIPPASAFTGAADGALRFRFARLVSAGPDGVLATPPDRLAGRISDGTAAARGDDLVLFLNRSDVYEAETP